jgi:dienelactone hydrolase
MKGGIMKRILGIFVILFFVVSCNNSTSQEKNENHLINRLEKAENSKDINEIKLVFDENAILYTTELMPVKKKSGIVSIYQFVFSRNDVENVEYKVDSTNKSGQFYYEYGKLTTKKNNQENIIQSFKAVFEKQNNDFKILEISFGKEDKLKKELPRMLEPTGIYKVGERTFFYDKSQSGNGRLLSFQIWYPTNSDSKEKQPFRSEQVILSASSFLGIPNFFTSYFSEIESNTISNALTISNKSFPVLIYNHGYGGFTQVYQTVFEDLVSHGYIVVSVGHENESALLIKENGEVISNTPDNEFYRKRELELNSEEIGRWQSIILNSSDAKENEEAYRKMLQLTPLHNESTNLWESDTKAVLEKIKTINNEDKNIHGIFDLDRIGIFGHSLGGATAGQMCFGKTEIKAGINLDGFQFGDLYENKLEVPFMFVSSNQESNRYLRALTFIDNSKQDCYQVAIKGFSHDNFTDLKYITEGDKDAMELQRALIISFFDKYIKGKELDIKELEMKFEPINISASNISNDYQYNGIDNNALQ